MLIPKSEFNYFVSHDSFMLCVFEFWTKAAQFFHFCFLLVCSYNLYKPLCETVLQLNTYVVSLKYHYYFKFRNVFNCISYKEAEEN